MRLSYKEIEARVASLGKKQNYDRDFIFDLLLAYGRTSGNVARLRSEKEGSLNVAENPSSEVAQKNIVYFKEIPKASDEELLATIEELSSSAAVFRFNTRFVIVTDYHQLLARDTKTAETLIIEIGDIADHVAFFLPWAGMEKAQYTSEAHADVRAAERMAKLFDELINFNPRVAATPGERHQLNVFFTRLLFCFFAEDTGIFQKDQFTNSVATLTRDDGSDLHEFLADLFQSLNTESKDDKPRHFNEFPFVNGRLFASQPGQNVPFFNKKSRDFLIESGKLQWSQINPDIFGSMFQAIVTPGQRSELGQHYTSVPNILKTIEPLFLDSLKAELDSQYENESKLAALLTRIAKIKVFDPACGSGNFLVIAYKELRKLEHALLERLGELRGRHYGMFDSTISIENFFGIELDDFAAEVAVLSLWIAKHQMNVEFQQKFGTEIPLIPLKEMGHIHHGNAARVDWNSICPNDGQTEIYLIGNPPYVGSSMQSSEQKADLEIALSGRQFSKNLDYISIWFIKGAKYISNTLAELAFVSTNSVSQGDHVALLFPQIMDEGIEIGYAYTSFKWENNAKRNAGVTVVVINLRNPRPGPKFIYTNGIKKQVSAINGYLVEGPSVYVSRRSSVLSLNLPRMVRGSQPSDGGHLVLTRSEMEKLLSASEEAAHFIKKYLGASEFINDIERYCIWVEPGEEFNASNIPELNSRFELVAAFRRGVNDKDTRELAATPWRFKQPAYTVTESIIVPGVSSERRDYIPIGYLDADTVISNAAFAVYDAKPWLFALLTSRMHMVWTRAISGKMKTDYRYSNTIVYNNFPLPALPSSVKEQLTDNALRVLDVREYHSEMTLAELYDPDKMPENLRKAHSDLDLVVDAIYRQREFVSDDERLSLLLEMFAMQSNLGK